VELVAAPRVIHVELVAPRDEHITDFCGPLTWSWSPKPIDTYSFLLPVMVLWIAGITSQDLHQAAPTARAWQKEPGRISHSLGWLQEATGSD